GPKFKKIDRDCSMTSTRVARLDSNTCHAISDSGPARGFKVQSIDMSDLAEFLTRKLDRPVVDRTALKGLFDMSLGPWNPFLNGVPANRAGGPVESLPTLFVAVEEQLGLKLSAARGPLDVMAVDDAGAPTEN